MESVTGAGSSSEGGSDIVMELGSCAAAGAGAGPGPRLAVILCGGGVSWLLLLWRDLALCSCCSDTNWITEARLRCRWSTWSQQGVTR